VNKSCKGGTGGEKAGMFCLDDEMYVFSLVFGLFIFFSLLGEGEGEKEEVTLTEEGDCEPIIKCLDGE
jgi:hypothetical protein